MLNEAVFESIIGISILSRMLNYKLTNKSVSLVKVLNLCMETLIVHPENKKQLAALKNFMKAFKISFEEENTGYDPEFVKMIKQGDKDLKDGKGVKVDIDSLLTPCLEDDKPDF